MAEGGIFRQKSLDNLNSPEHIDKYIKVTTPSVYVILATITMLIASVFIWGIFGSITDKSTIAAVVFPTDGTMGVNVPNKGTMRTLFVHKGDLVEKGQPLAMISVEEAFSVLSAPISGSVLNILDENKDFESFEPIVTLINNNVSKEQVNTMVTFVPFDIARKLRVGMDIEATPRNLTREKDGYVKGKITRIDKYPISREEAVKKMKVETYATDLFPEQGAAFEIEMELNEMVGKDGKKTLEWSFANNQDTDMSVGTFCNIQVITKRRSVYQYLFESLREQKQKIDMIIE